MPSAKDRTIVIPLRLGPVSRVNRSLFSLFRMKDTMRQGSLFLEATLDEIVQIRQMAEHKSEFGHLFENAKDQYDELMGQKEALEARKVSLKPWKILELLSMIKETNLFVVAGCDLYNSTKTTSEKIRRGLLSVPSLNILPAEESISADEEVEGIAIPLSGDLDDDTSTIITETASILTNTDPFADPQPLADGGDNTSISAGFMETSRESGHSNSSLSHVVKFTYIENYHSSTTTLSGVETGAATISINSGCPGNAGVTQYQGSPVD